MYTFPSHKTAILLICALVSGASLFTSLPSNAQELQYMREREIKRLYREASELVKRGGFDDAIELYNKAIEMAEDEDIKRFLVNEIGAARAEKLDE